MEITELESRVRQTADSFLEISEIKPGEFKVNFRDNKYRYLRVRLESDKLPTINEYRFGIGAKYIDLSFILFGVYLIRHFWYTSEPLFVGLDLATLVMFSYALYGWSCGRSALHSLRSVFLARL